MSTRRSFLWGLAIAAPAAATASSATAEALAKLTRESPDFLAVRAQFEAGMAALRSDMLALQQKPRPVNGDEIYGRFVENERALKGVAIAVQGIPAVTSDGRDFLQRAAAFAVSGYLTAATVADLREESKRLEAAA